MRIGAVIHPTAVSGSERGPQLQRFSRHVIEMTVAMMLGMCVLGMTFRAIHLAVFGTGFDAAWHEHTELAVDVQHDAADGGVDALPRSRMGALR
jgi:hypothetical protein